MAFSGGRLGEDLARTLVELYAAAEARIATDIARMLRDGQDAPDWAERKLAALGTLRRRIEAVIARLDGEMGAAVEQTLVLAVFRGGQAALDELARLGRGTPAELAEIRDALPGAEAVQRLVGSLVTKLRGTHLRILRWGLDAYRDVIAATAPSVLLGTQTRLQASRAGWDRLMSDGITGFIDKSGRRWNLVSYVEMATRATVAQAATQAHLDRLGAADIDLIIVSNAPQECERCRPWEGKILTANGAPGRRTVARGHATDDSRAVRVRVAGSFVEAVAAGLMHPNCRHSIGAYLPGITTVPTDTADPQGDEDRQRLRALEREVRKHKRRALAALDDDTRKAAQRRVRQYQEQIRDHVAATGLHRQRHREQIWTPDGEGRTTGVETPPTPTPQPETIWPGRERDEPSVDDLTDLPEVGDLVPTEDDDIDERRGEIEEAIVDIIEGREFGSGFHVVLDEIELHANLFGFSADIYQGDRRVGSTTRTFLRDEDDGTLSVDHAYLSLHDSARRHGFASSWNRYLEAWYRRSGLLFITIHAALDDGGYVWAAAGFEPANQNAADELLDRLRVALERLVARIAVLVEQMRDTDSAGRAELFATITDLQRQASAGSALIARAENSSFGDDDYPTAYEFSQVGKAPGATTWLGLQALRGSNWYGVKRLD